jgi:hypothetical protein
MNGSANFTKEAEKQDTHTFKNHNAEKLTAKKALEQLQWRSAIVTKY